MDNTMIIIQIIIGIIICLFGLKFQKTVFAIIGCGIGYLLGSYIVNALAITGGLDIVLKAGLAFIVGAFSFTLFEFLLAIIVGVELFIVIGDMFNTMWYGYIIGLIAGIIGGLLTKKFYKLGIILVTSLIGSYIVANNIMSYFDISYLLLFGIIFVCSVLFQSTANKI